MFQWQSRKAALEVPWIIGVFQVNYKRKYTEKLYANKQMLKEPKDHGLLDLTSYAIIT
jgi:hypothetical protein